MWDPGTEAPVEAAHLAPVIGTTVAFMISHVLPHLPGPLPVRNILGCEISARHVVPGPAGGISLPVLQDFVGREWAVLGTSRAQVSGILAKVGCTCVGN